MSIDLMQDFSFKHSDEVGNSMNVGDPTTVKAKLDSQAIELRDYINGLVAILNEDGANNLSAKGFNNLKTTIQVMLNDLNIRKAEATRVKTAEDNISGLQINKVDQGGNFTGTWQGLKPSQVEPGLSAFVDSLPYQTKQVYKIKSILKRNNKLITTTLLTELRNSALQKLDGSKVTTTDGSNLTIWTPDGVGTYPNLWTRDFALMLEGYLDYFSDTDIENTFRYIAGKCNAITYEVPDNIGKDGAVVWKPGNNSAFGVRASADGNPFLVDILYNHYKKTGKTNLYNEFKSFIKNIMDVGVPYNSSTGCAYVDTANPFVSWGFCDTVKLTGNVLFLSLLCYQAYIQLADMAYENGDNADFRHYLDRADTLKSGINNTLWSGSYWDNASNNLNDGLVGLYKASTGLCSGQRDIWGSALAVWLGVADEAKSMAIAKYLVGQQAQYIFNGGIRHVPKNEEYAAGSHAWESYFQEPTYGIYQNGGYWATPVAWVCYAMSLLDAKESYKLMSDCISYQIYGNGNVNMPYEWMAENNATGVKKYTAHAALPLSVLENAQLSSSTGGGSGTTSADISCKVYNSANQSIPTNALTALSFNTEEFDTDNIHSTATNPTRLTCITAGKYMIIGYATFDANNAGQRALKIRKNGTNVVLENGYLNLSTTMGVGMHVSTILDLAAGDYVELIAWQNSGVALNILALSFSPYFMMVKVN